MILQVEIQHGIKARVNPMISCVLFSTNAIFLLLFLTTWTVVVLVFGLIHSYWKILSHDVDVSSATEADVPTLVDLLSGSSITSTKLQGASNFLPWSVAIKTFLSKDKL